MKTLLPLFALVLGLLPTSAAQAAPPANDNKASAEVFSGDSASATVSNAEATKEAGDFANRTLWWKWTAGGHGTLNLDCVNSTAGYLAIAVYLLDGSGTVTGTVTISGSSFSTPPSRTFPVASGTSYLICVGTTATSSSGSGTVKLGLSLNRSTVIGSLPIAHSATMANDSFANRITLTGDVVTALGYTYSATTEPGEPSSAENRSLWWQYRPSQNGRLTITSANSLHAYPKIAVFMGTSINNLRAVRSNGSFSGASLTIPVTAGVDYKISYGTSSSSEVGTAILNLSLNTTADVSSLPTPPVTMENDNFSERVTLTGDSVGAIAYNSSATTETGEPSLAGNRTFWWTYRPSGNGVLSISSHGTDFPYSVISVYLGDTLSGLKGAVYGEALNEVVMNFPVTGGVDYQIAFGTTSSNSSSTGSLVMRLTLNKSGPVGALDPLMTATMANDAFASRMILTGRTVSALGYTLGAAKEALEPAAVGYRTLWYSWTANETGQAVLDFTGSYLNSEAITSWTGGSLSTLAPASLYQLGGYLLGMQVTKGVTYHLCLGHSRSDRAGYFVMTITGPEFVPTAPLFTEKPQSKWVGIGSTLNLTSMTNDGSASYQWRQDTKAIVGQMSAGLSRPITTLAQAGVYDVTATNGIGSTGSEAAHVGVHSVVAPVPGVAEGGKVTLSITAQAPGGVRYRWRRNGVQLTDGKVGTRTIAGAGTAKVTITGLTLADAGAYTCELRMNDPKNAGADIVGISGTSMVNVVQKPVVADMVVPTAAVSRSFSWQLEATHSPTGYIISGLPSGLTANLVTGLITGIPNAKGQPKVRVSAKNAAGTGPVKEFILNIGELTPGLAGTYAGLVERHEILNASLGGTITATITSSGMISGTLKLGTASYTLKSRAMVPLSGDPTATMTIALSRTQSATLTLTFDVGNGILDGVLVSGEESMQMEARLNTWSKTNLPTGWAGTYNVMIETPSDLPNIGDLPRGMGYMQLSISSTTGAVKVTGMTGDGASFTGAAILWANGSVPVHSLLYSNKGSIRGLPIINVTVDTADNFVTGNLDWQKTGPASAADRVYRDGFEVVTLDLDGSKWVKPAAGTMLFGWPNMAGNARVEFSEGGIGGVSQADSVSQTFQITTANTTKFATATTGNPCVVTMTLNMTTGHFTGSFKLKDPKPGSTATVPRTVNYAGILMSHLEEGFGWFKLPGMTSTAPTEAGLVHLKRP